MRRKLKNSPNTGENNDIGEKNSIREATERQSIELRTSVDIHTARLKDVDIKQKIGGGKFGDVYKGLWKGTIEVALKKTKVDNGEFEKEAQTLRLFLS